MGCVWGAGEREFPHTNTQWVQEGGGGAGLFLTWASLVYVFPIRIATSKRCVIPTLSLGHVELVAIAEAVGI